MTMTESEYRECIAEALLPEYKSIIDKADDSHVFSPKFEKRMDKLIRHRRKPYYRFTNTVGKRVAVIIIGIITVSFTTVMSVEALRTPFLDFFMSIFSTHSEVRTFDDGGDYPEKIENYYEIKYDLSNYSIDNRYDDETEHKIEYRTKDIYICFKQNVVKNYITNYNTENTQIESLNFNGYEAIGFMDNQRYYTLTWNNGKYIIEISSNIGKDVLIEMAKSVQKVE